MMKMTPQIAGATVSLGLVAVAFAAAIIGFSYGFIDDGRIAGGFLPVVSATVVIITGLFDVFSRLRVKSVDTEKPKDDLDIFGRTQKTRDRQLVVVVFMVAGGLLIIDVIGFLAAFTVLILTISLFVEKKKPLTTILVTAGTILVTYLVFDVFLEVPLPLGIFGR
jgi:putative tricarboxylic transport membrane protein